MVTPPHFVSRGTSWLCHLQGGYYAITGVWPLVHPDTFEAVTGAKRDFWLAQTVGMLLAVTGFALISASWARRITPEISAIAIGQAAGLGIFDLITLREPRTATVYLADAVVEMVIVLAWCYCLFGRSRPVPQGNPDAPAKR